MNGSNSFARTPLNNGGGAETYVTPGIVMIAISYGVDGTVTIYRDGEIYASHAQGAPISYPGTSSEVLIGLRHADASGQVGTAGGDDPYFAGVVDEARVYDVPLDASQIRTLTILGPEVD